MRKSTFTILAATSFLAVPLLAQEADTAMQEPMPEQPPAAEAAPPAPEAAPVPSPELTVDQQLLYDGWPEDQRLAYDMWPGDAQTYFWTLTPERQGIFWRLSDQDKLALVAMAETDRETAWQSVEQQIAQAQAQQQPAPMPEGDTSAPSDDAMNGDAGDSEQPMPEDEPDPMQ